jgi:hypothetical protein
MEQIVPNLYDNLNLNTLPKIIKDEFFKMSTRWRDVTDIKPFNSNYRFEDENLSFFTHIDVSKFIESMIVKKTLLNEKYEILTYNEFSRDYIKEYGRGFYKGYAKYSNELNQGNQIFEPDNTQIAHKIFSKVIKKSNFTKVIGFPISLIPMQDGKQIKTSFNREIDYFLSKESFYNSGIEGGEFYKSWSLILHNPTLFEDIFNKHFKTSEKKEEVIIETPDLTLKDIPNFNLQQRYEIFTQLGYDKAIHTLDTSKGSKNKILALLMGISVDNAKHLINGTYKEFKPEDIEEFDEYLERIKVKL